MILHIEWMTQRHYIASIREDQIGGFLDTGLRQQTLFDLEAFENAASLKLSEEEREEFIDVQHQANRWTYLGTGMTHPKFIETLGGLDRSQRKSIEDVAPIFC